MPEHSQSVSGVNRGLLVGTMLLAPTLLGLICLLDLPAWQFITAQTLLGFSILSLLGIARFFSQMGYNFGCGRGKLHLGRRTIMLSQMESIALDAIEKDSSFEISISVTTAKEVVNYRFEFAKGYGTEGKILKVLAIVSRDWNGSQKNLLECNQFLAYQSSC